MRVSSSPSLLSSTESSPFAISLYLTLVASISYLLSISLSLSHPIRSFSAHISLIRSILFSTFTCVRMLVHFSTPPSLTSHDSPLCPVSARPSHNTRPRKAKLPHSAPRGGPSTHLRAEAQPEHTMPLARAASHVNIVVWPQAVTRISHHPGGPPFVSLSCRLAMSLERSVLLDPNAQTCLLSRWARAVADDIVNSMPEPSLEVRLEIIAAPLYYFELMISNPVMYYNFATL